MPDIKEVDQLVRELNDEFNDAMGQVFFDYFGHAGFLLQTDGNQTCIEFLGVVLWDSENDERTHEEDECEPLDTYVRRESHKLLQQLNKITFWKGVLKCTSTK